MKLKLLQLEEKKIEEILLVRADCLFHELLLNANHFSVLFLFIGKRNLSIKQR